MSQDTEVRTIALINSLIVTPNGYYMVDESLNEDLRDQGSGPFISVGFDVFSDHLSGLKVGEKQYIEEGTVIFEIFSEKGTGTRELAIIRDQIRNGMRDYTSTPTVGQEGTIYYYDLNQQPVFDDFRHNSTKSWKVLRVFLNYTKAYDV
jgi:hypothetical protein